jgi:hypothetical protein
MVDDVVRSSQQVANQTAAVRVSLADVELRALDAWKQSVRQRDNIRVYNQVSYLLVVVSFLRRLAATAAARCAGAKATDHVIACSP